MNYGYGPQEMDTAQDLVVRAGRRADPPIYDACVCKYIYIYVLPGISHAVPLPTAPHTHSCFWLQEPRPEQTSPLVPIGHEGTEILGTLTQCLC